MNISARQDTPFLAWAATASAVAISAAAGWVAMSTAVGEIGPVGVDGAPTDAEFWTPVGWAAMFAVVPITVAAWRSSRWGVLALVGAAGVQVVVATAVVGRYTASDFNTGGLDGLIYLVPMSLAAAGAISATCAVAFRRWQRHSDAVQAPY